MQPTSVFRRSKDHGCRSIEPLLEDSESSQYIARAIESTTGEDNGHWYYSWLALLRTTRCTDGTPCPSISDRIRPSQTQWAEITFPEIPRWTVPQDYRTVLQKRWQTSRRWRLGSWVYRYVHQAKESHLRNVYSSRDIILLSVLSNNHWIKSPTPQSSRVIPFTIHSWGHSTRDE